MDRTTCGLSSDCGKEEIVLSRVEIVPNGITLAMDYRRIEAQGGLFMPLLQGRQQKMHWGNMLKE